MIVVGVDPGVRTGLAVWDTSSRQLLDVRCSGIIDAMRYLRELQETRGIGLVVFEDARKRKWIPRERDLSQFRGRAMGAGSVEFVCPPPRQGMTKLTDAYFRGLTGYDRRTNEHGRDAAMLVFGR